MIMNTRYTYHIRGVAENAWKDQWYIGSRTSTHGRTPEEDIGIHYFTSSTNDDFVAQFKSHPEWFICTILERGYADNVVMGEDEERRITESWNVPGRINRKGRLPLFERDEAFKAKIAASLRKMHASPEYQETMRKRRASPEYKANHAAAMRKSAQNPVHRATRAAANRKLAQGSVWKAAMHKVRATPEWKAKQAAVNRNRAQDPVWKAKNAAVGRKNAQNPVWKANVAAANRKLAQDPEFGKKISDGMKRARALREADNC